MAINNDVIRANRKYEGQICAICKNEISLGDFIHICPNCQSVNHEECWKNEGGCNNFSCNSLSVKSNNYIGSGLQNRNSSYGNNTQRPSFKNSDILNNYGMGSSQQSGIRQSSPNMVACKFCKEPIMRGTRKCIHCGEYQNEKDKIQSSSQSDGTNSASLSIIDWIFIVICPCLSIIIGAIYCGTDQKVRGLTVIKFSAIVFGILYLLFRVFAFFVAITK